MIRDAHETSRWTTSVCTGSLLLGAAGILEGLEATSHWAAREGLAQFGATPVAKRVVEQGKVITAAGVSAGIDMALPPFESGTPEKASPEAMAQLQSVLSAGQ